MLQRTEGTFSGLTHLRGVLVKGAATELNFNFPLFFCEPNVHDHFLSDDYCNDHFLGISTLDNLEWNWGTTMSTARFVWSCGYRYIYGQIRTAYTVCTELRTYTIDVSVSSAVLEFKDDLCGTLKLDDDLGSSPSSLFVYVGADDDDGTAEWDSLSVWGSLDWDMSESRAPTLRPTNLPVPSPVVAPTVLPTAALGDPTIADDFAFFDNRLWNAQCAGCKYIGGNLLVSGDSMLQRSYSTFGALKHIKGTIIKNSMCNDHIVAVSSIAAIGWSWTSGTGAARFLW